MQIDCFSEKMILSAFWIKLKCRWLQFGLADLEKHQTLAFLLMADCLRIFEITHFLRFFIFFENYQKHMLKWLNAFCFISTW